MENVTVKKDQLLETLRTNRAQHRDVFLKAQDGYRKAAIQQLEKMLADARDGKNIRLSVHLVAPMDQTKDYDRAIRMLEMSTENEIVLTEQDFQCYVMDEWQWRGQFAASTAAYMGEGGQ